MPGLDGSGPTGGGPMTGGGRGYCSPRVSYGFGRSWPRRGISFGYGRGRGRGYRHMFWQTGLPRWARGRSGWGRSDLEPSYSRENEISMLQEEADALKDDLNAIEQRMRDLEAEKKSDD